MLILLMILERLPTSFASVSAPGLASCSRRVGNGLISRLGGRGAAAVVDDDNGNRGEDEYGTTGGSGSGDVESVLPTSCTSISRFAPEDSESESESEPESSDSAYRSGITIAGEVGVGNTRSVVFAVCVAIDLIGIPLLLMFTSILWGDERVNRERLWDR